MISYNLLDNAWIPALHNDGRIRDVGLRELLKDAHHFREVAHDSPQFVASMLTLCIAILQRAWPGESSRERNDEWERVWNLRHFDGDFLDKYLAQYEDRFDLFDEQFPFYQTAGLQMAEASFLSRLAMEEQNAPTMFANIANPDWAAPSPALAAQLLLTIQSWALGFGKSSRAKIGTEEIEPPYSADGPLLRGLTIWPSGSTFFETLMLNLVPHQLAADDRPSWELDAPHELRDIATKSGRETQRVRGICDLLTVQSRLIRLLPVEIDGEIAVPTAYFTQGRSLPKTDPPSFHPFKLYVEGGTAGIMPLALNENKAIWRNSNALFNKENRQRGDLNALDFVSRQRGDYVIGDDFKAGLDVVGMATEPGKAGKFLLWRHDRLPLPRAILVDENLENRVRDALNAADLLAEEMRQRFATVARTLVMPEKLSGGSPDPEDVKNVVNKFDPRRPFWPRLENHFLDLLKRLSDEPEAAMAQWQLDVEEAAKDCFAASCNSLGHGPNAVIAVAQVSSKFSLEQAQKKTSGQKTKKEKQAA